jgi:hypothetical protein
MKGCALSCATILMDIKSAANLDKFLSALAGVPSWKGEEKG